MDAQHFPAFYRKHVKKIYRFLYFRVGGDKELAEDLAQDVFLKALHAFDRYNKETSESAWIYTIARNHLINEMKKRRPQIPIEDIENVNFEREPWVAKSERKDDERALLNAMGKLAPDERELIERKYMEGWSFAELAEERGTTSGALRVKATRTLKKLKGHVRTI